MGYTAGITDCSISFRKWQKLMAASTENAVRADRRAGAANGASDTL